MTARPSTPGFGSQVKTATLTLEEPPFTARMTSPIRLDGVACRRLMQVPRQVPNRSAVAASPLDGSSREPVHNAEMQVRQERPRGGGARLRVHGVTFFDTAEAYGPFTNQTLVGEAL